MSIAANKKIILQGGARADNIMWVVAGASSFGAGSRFQGNILSATSAAFLTGSTIDGRVLVQTAVTLQMTTVTNPSSPPTANDVATQLMDAASAKKEEADIKRKEATDKRAAANQKKEEAIVKRAVADTKKKDSDAKTAKAQETRDTMLGEMTDVKKKKKTQLLADAAIAGVHVTKVKASFTAATEIAACDDAYLKLGIISTLGACDISNASPDRRHLLADTAYLVEILLSSAEVNQSAMVAALTSLSAAGVTAETTEEDALVLLSTVPGIDNALLTTLKFDATAAAAATAIAATAEANAVATETAAANLEIDAAATEKAAVDLAAEATALDKEAAAAAEHVPPPSSPSPPPSPPPTSAVLDDSGAASLRTVFSTMVVVVAAALLLT